MPQIINTIIPAELYNSFLIDHDATERAATAGLKQAHVPRLWEILEKHDLTKVLEPHLLHRHFGLEEGEILVHRDLHVAGDDEHGPTEIGIAKMMKVDDSIKANLVPLLWMVSTEGNLVAYEFGIKESLNAIDRQIKHISTAIWTSFIQEFADYVQKNDLSDIVSLKNRGCLNGGEYVSPSQRALFRVPYAKINLQRDSYNLESGWINPEGQPQPSDGHVTKTRQTAGGTVAHYHVTEEIGPNAIDPAEVSPYYVTAMWAAQGLPTFWTSELSAIASVA
ncbi:hypothetical protein C1H76_5991 [Elsinoe australis]|uniref:Uncharacterized protein n=1 Tax=Elsinoe australis TaxID=40998 RepID=A0A4U7AWC3_9PEZI|nr:hypothetical protein C1H76_5991 [Elsinoe australis]